MNFSVKNLLRKGDLWFYRRRVPIDLLTYYSGKKFVYASLHTHDLTKAAEACKRLTQEHDALWEVLRAPGGLDLTKEQVRAQAEKLLSSWGVSRFDLNPFSDKPINEPEVKRKVEAYISRKHKKPVSALEEKDFSEAELEAFSLLTDNPKHISLSEACEFYISEHKSREVYDFTKGVRRAIQFAVDTIGDKPLIKISREDARQVRDKLLADPKKKTTTVKRNLSLISAAINFTILEKELSCENQFAKLKIPNCGQDAEKRIPFTAEELQTISQACLMRDDEVAWIAATMIETGPRIGEVACARVEDIFLDHDIPHILIRPNVAEGRTLKTSSSARAIPLKGAALWAVQQALSHAEKAGSEWLFPQFGEGSKAPLAAEYVNDWIRGLGIDRTSHSFRHALIDRLLNADVSDTLAKRLTGHSPPGIHDKYGSGPSLKRYSDALDKVVLPFEAP